MTTLLVSFTSFISNFVSLSVPMDVDEARPGLFAQCSFVVVRSANLSEEQAQKVRPSPVHYDKY